LFHKYRKEGKGCQCTYIRRQRITVHQLRYRSHCSSECVVYGRLPHWQASLANANFL